MEILHRGKTLLLVLVLCFTFISPFPNPGNAVVAAAPNADYTLTLGGVAFDPLVSQPALPLAWRQSSTPGPDLHLVQFFGPTRELWLETLAKVEVEIVQYIRNYTGIGLVV